MSGPVLLSSNVLVENPQARALHEAAFEAEHAGQFGSAHAKYQMAVSILEMLPESIGNTVQTAHIERDEGFTYLLQAQKAEPGSDEAIFKLARRHILRSVRGLGRLAGREEIDGDPVPMSIQREIFSESGGSLGVLGRLAVAEAVKADVDMAADTPEAEAGRQERAGVFKVAHEHNLIGGNGYYRVNNAMNFARERRLSGKNREMAAWAGRALYGVAWTATNDTRNLKNSLRTAVGRLPHLRSRQAARASVARKP